jgi:hypothetical protein
MARLRAQNGLERRILFALAIECYEKAMAPRARRSGLASLPALLALSAALTLSGRASAQSATAQARALFKEARTLMDRERYEKACPKLEESLRLDYGMGTQFNLAHCWEKLGRTASAWGMFLDVAAAASREGQAKRESAARERAAALEPKLTRLRIEVQEPVDGLTVTRSGDEVGRAAWGEPMPVDPGSQHIEATAPGKKAWSKDVEVVGVGKTASVRVPALEDIAPPPPEPEPVVQTEPPMQGVGEDRAGGGGMSGGRLAGTLLLAGVGAGGVVTGALFGLKTSSETNKARQLCNGGPEGIKCDSLDPDGERAEMFDHRDKAKQARTVSYVAFGAGGAALLGSAVLWLTAPSSGREGSSAGLQMKPTLAPGLASLSIRGTF